MIGKFTKKCLRAQVEKYFWSECTFISHHSQLEQLFWPDSIDAELSNATLKLGLAEHEPLVREELPLDQYAVVERLILDNLALKKIAFLIQQAWSVDSVSKRNGLTGKVRNDFIFEPKVDETRSRLFDKTEYVRAIRETDLSGVTTLEIFLYNEGCPWTKSEGDAIAIIPCSDSEVQKKLACVLKCMPAIENIVIKRDFEDGYFAAKKKLVRHKAGDTYVKETTGAEVAAELRRADRKMERWLQSRIPRSFGSLMALLKIASKTRRHKHHKRY